MLLVLLAAVAPSLFFVISLLKSLAKKFSLIFLGPYCQSSLPFFLRAELMKSPSSVTLRGGPHDLSPGNTLSCKSDPQAIALGSSECLRCSSPSEPLVPRFCLICPPVSCYYFSFLFFFYLPHQVLVATCGNLAPQPRIEPVLPPMEVQNLNHWTTREAFFLPFSYYSPLNLHLKRLGASQPAQW